MKLIKPEHTFSYMSLIEEFWVKGTPYTAQRSRLNMANN